MKVPALPTLTLAAALIVQPGCSRAPAAPAPPPPPEVTVVTLEPRAVELPVEVPGRLQGSREVEVKY